MNEEKKEERERDREKERIILEEYRAENQRQKDQSNEMYTLKMVPVHGSFHVPFINQSDFIQQQ